MCSRSTPPKKDGGAAPTEYSSATITAGRTAPTKLMHLSAHPTELLELSWSLQLGQHGMSALPGIDISTGVVGTAVRPVAGIMATETAIRAVRTMRTAAICKLSGGMD